MKWLLKRIPGVITAYRHATFLRWTIREKWFEDRQRMNDDSHLRREWNFESPAEQERHELMLEAIARHQPEMSQAQVLELGCSDGVFTARIAQCCASVTACDISPVARKLAVQRCHRFTNVAFLELDLARDTIPGQYQYDVVFAMDILEFIHGRNHLQAVVRRLANALRPGGLLAVSSCRLPAELRNAWWMRWLPEGGDAIAKLIAAEPALRMVHCEVHPRDGFHIEGYIDHVIAVYRKGE